MRLMLKNRLTQALATVNGGDGLVPRSERSLLNRLVRELDTFLEKRNIEITPFLVLRLEELVTAYFVARRLEEPLRRLGVFQGEEVGFSDAVARSTSAVEAAARARARLRHVIQELEAVCDRDRTVE